MAVTENTLEAMKRTVIEGRAIPLRGNDIDTDRIIPARYLKRVTFEQLGAYAFYDERFDASGGKKAHPFNDPHYAGGEILVVNKNFGCGSSREHAPQSLMRMGIRAIVGESFAEIFAGNCTALGIPTVRASEADIEKLMAAVEADPSHLVVDLVAKKVLVGSGTDRLSFAIDQSESSRSSLTSGTWDTTAALLANREKIEAVRNRLAYINGY
jgi:3-isopropylmalate/(R)-2-methylmalate dehydratase small subunit